MNLMDILRLDLRELETEYRKLASVLEKLGLSDYEARAVSYTHLTLPTNREV